MEPPTVAPGRRRPARGFTLIELLIVVTIIAIASALAVPLFNSTRETKLRAAAGRLAADIDFARSESISHGDAPRAIVFDSATQSYRLALASAPATPLTNGVGKVPYVVTFGSGSAATLSGVTLGTLSVGSGSQLVFGMYGQLTSPSTSASVTLASGNSSIALAIDASTGEVTIAAPVLAP